MKKVIIFLLISLSITTVTVATVKKTYKSIPLAKITLKVVDDEGKPVEGADSGVGFYQLWNPKMGVSINGYTDENGIYTAEGETHGECAYSVMKEGYYMSEGKYNWSKGEVKNGKWHPWNPIIKIVLKRKRNPIPMYARTINYIYIPELNKPIGYDLIKADWVKPYGKGEVSDFIFYCKAYFKNIDNREIHLTLTFSNDGDGIMEYEEKNKYYKSEFRFPYEAPLIGYKKQLKKYFIYTEKLQKDNIKKDTNYIFRVRTKKDKNGKIISAMYGKIYGEIGFDIENKNKAYVTFIYCLNPTGTRNLEFESDRNLFEDADRLSLFEGSY